MLVVSVFSESKAEGGRPILWIDMLMVSANSIVMPLLSSRFATLNSEMSKSTVVLAQDFIVEVQNAS